MDIKKRIINHNRRWNISLDIDEQFSQLRNRVIRVINDFLSDSLTNDQKTDKQFRDKLDTCLGREPELKRNSIFYLPIKPGIFPQDKRVFTDTYLYKEIKESKNIKQLATALQVLFWVLEDVNKDLPLDKIVKELREAAELSPNTGFHITLSKKRVILYPPGAKLLDQRVINDVLEWLDQYPKVAKYFEQALKFHAEGNSNEYRNLLDNLRFSIEQLLKEVLDNDKSLEKQKDELLAWLKQRKNHQWIINLYQQLLHYYCKYQNDAVKHDEEFSKDELEFMIYLTGIFIRFLIQPKPNE